MNSIMDIIYVPFGYVLRFLNQICGGQYILTLLLFALVVKLVMLPFSIKQQKNQIKGALLRPKMALIEKKYGGRNDQRTLEKKRMELMELQQREGYSPLAGCLPLLIQFPIIIALYNIIRAPLTYIARFSEKLVAEIHNICIDLGTISGDKLDAAGATFKQIKNLNQYGMVDTIKSNPDAFSHLEGFTAENLPNFEVLGGLMNLSETPSFKFASGANPWLLIIPLLTFIGSVVTMKLTRHYSGNLQAELAGQSQQNNASMKIMEWMMPLMSLWISFVVSSALGLYWFYQSLFGLVQIVILNKIWPMPKITEEDIKAYEKSLKSKPKAQREIDPDAPKPRSLHHIDDDDE